MSFHLRSLEYDASQDAAAGTRVEIRVKNRTESVRRCKTAAAAHPRVARSMSPSHNLYHLISMYTS